MQLNIGLVASALYPLKGRKKLENGKEALNGAFIQ
jgi:hypothetical protein